MSGTSLSATFTLDTSNAIASMVAAGKATETEAARMLRVLKQVGQQLDFVAKATKTAAAVQADTSAADAQAKAAADAAAAQARLTSAMRNHEDWRESSGRAELARQNAIRMAATQAAAQVAANNQPAQDAHVALYRQQAEAVQKATGAMVVHTVASREARVAANMLTQANRNLSYQITDIGTSLAGGMPWHLILIQQGGQIKDAYGGIIPALRGILGLVTPVGVAIGAAAAVVGTLGSALYFGAKDSEAFQKALALVGNTTGTTDGQFNGLIKTMQQGRGAMAGDVRAVMQAILDSGQATSTTFESMGRATLALTKLNGQSAVENVKVFSGIADGVTDWATKANKAYNFLTVEQYKQISALEAQGRTSEAARLAMDLLNNTLESRTAPVLGVIGNLLKDGSEWWAKWWESAKGVGRAETAEDRIQAMRDALERARGLNRNAVPGTGDFGVARRLSELAVAEKDLADFQRLEGNAAARLAQNKDDILKASRQYQDALATITRAGQERVFAELTNGMDRTEQAVKAAYASGITNGQQYRDAMYVIAKQHLADEITLAQQQVAIEASRPVKTELETRAKEGAVAGAQNKLIALQGKGQKLDAEYLTGDVQTYRDLIAEINKYNAVSDEMAGTTRKLTDNEKWRLDEMDKLDKAMSKMTLNEYDNAKAKIISAEASRKNAEQIRKSTEMEAEMQKLLADKGLVGDQRSMGDNMSIAAGKYFNSLPDEAKRAEALVTAIFTRMEDAVVNFAKTGKLSFSDLFSFMAEEYLRNAIRMTMKSSMTDAAGNFSLSSLWNSATALFSPHANGLDYVPYNNYPAMLHEGERVLTRQDAANGAAYGKGENITISHGDIHVGQGVSRGEVAAALKIQQASTVELIRRRDRTGRWA